MTTSTLTRAERCEARDHQLYHRCGDGTDCMLYRAHNPEDYERSARGYEVAVAVLRTERVGNSTAGNPRYRFHTDKGIYVTADDVQLGAGMTGDETGAAVLRVDASRVIAWDFLTTDDQKG